MIVLVICYDLVSPGTFFGYHALIVAIVVVGARLNSDVCSCYLL